jgi:hypothetical protein
VVSTGILGDLVLPEGAFDPDRADEIRELAAQVYATQARGPGTLRAYRSAWRQYDAWCTRLGLPALSADPRLVGMYLTAAADESTRNRGRLVFSAGEGGSFGGRIPFDFRSAPACRRPCKLPTSHSFWCSRPWLS